MVIKKAGSEIGTTQGNDDAAQLLAQDVTQEVDEKMETDGSASAGRVEARACEFELSGIQNLTPRGMGGFCEVEMSMPAGRLTVRHKEIGLDIRRRDGQTYLVLTGEDPEWSVERPLDRRDMGSVVDVLEIWTFCYGKPAAVCTDGGVHFGGLFRAWCGHHSIEHRICSWPRPLRSGSETTKMLLPVGRRQGVEQRMALSLPFWLQGRDHIWQPTRRKLLPGHESFVDTRHVVVFRNFWWLWVW